MAKTRQVQVPQTVRDGADDLAIRFYVPGPGATPRVEVVLSNNGNGDPVVIDRPITDFTNLTPANKNALRALLTTVRDQALTLEGFA